jgi:pimeloyl-ACP methyl ester carboxylesterase
MSMSTFVLIPGAADKDTWYWHLLEPELRALGHHTVAIDLPADDDRAGLAEYADAVVDQVTEAGAASADELVVVAQSMGGFTAPLVVGRLPVRMIVLLAAMTPAPGESPGEWWGNTGQPEAARAAAIADGRDPDADFDPVVTFLHDLGPELVEESADHVRDQSGTPFEKRWPLDAWPDVPTRFLLCRHDRLFPPDLQRRVVRERLGITPDEMDGGHLPALHSPKELAARLAAYADEL